MAKQTIRAKARGLSAVKLAKVKAKIGKREA